MIQTWDTFWPYGKEHGLFIIDMQRGFFEHNYTWIRRLKRNICEHVYHCLSQKWTVVIAEFEWFWETLPEIIEYAERWYRSWHTGKRRPGQWYISFSRNSNADLIAANPTARNYFQTHKTKKWTTWWVSTPACVKANAHGIKWLWLDVRIRAWLTINPSCAERNDISEFQEMIEEWIMFFPQCKMPTQDSLIDYLYTS